MLMYFMEAATPPRPEEPPPVGPRVRIDYSTIRHLDVRGRDCRPKNHPIRSLLKFSLICIADTNTTLHRLQILASYDTLWCHIWSYLEFLESSSRFGSTLLRTGPNHRYTSSCVKWIMSIWAIVFELRMRTNRLKCITVIPSHSPVGARVFFCRILHTMFSHLRAHAFARSVTVARSSAVQASFSRRQERRWAIVCGSPQSQSTDWASSR